MSALQRLNPQSVHAPLGKYSHLGITPAHASIATFSGQIGVEPGDTATSTSAQQQTRLVFAAIEALLHSQGATPADLIKLTTFIVGRHNLAGFNAARDEVYARWFPDDDFPGNTLVLVAGLATESILVEVEGTFACPTRATSHIP